MANGVYNPMTLEFEQPSGGPAIGTDPYNRIGDLAPETQFQLAARKQFGAGYADRPFASRYAQRSFQPMYGRFLATAQPSGWGTDSGTFAQWAGGTGRFGREQGGMGSQFGRHLEGATPQAWQQLVRTARGRSGLAPYADIREQQTAAGRLPDPNFTWQEMLSDPSKVQALTSYATYNPSAGGIMGQIQQGALRRAQQEFIAANPGSTAIDWFSHLTDPESGLSQFVDPRFMVQRWDPNAISANQGFADPTCKSAG